ncbi:MAG: AzlC family ABC transporter permease [Firmicutes bacterium]|nr:AzlC family ABC transporter permease [Bacillota bacterium]
MKDDLKFAFKTTIPVMLGYIFMGMAFGILYQKAGYNAVWAFFTALFVYAGSMQFMLVDLLTRGMGPLYSLLITLSVQCRHMFYGLTFIEDFKKMGKKAFYMVFSLTDETYSLLWSVKAKGHDLKRVRFFIALLDHSYWITGCTLGAALGTLIKFNVTGVDYAMTALFIVIFTEQWLTAKKHSSALIGLTAGLVFIVLLGVDKFLLPALIVSVAALVFKSRKEDADNARH